ncbi:MAG: glycosyl transferase group 1, partial [Cyanobacteria bacterium RYN_339]|nr:glycosyl transferase group 1 [Cyanobacteria bacterium RYN_339]
REAIARAPWRWPGRWAAAQAALWGGRGALGELDALLVPYPGHADMPLARRVADDLRVPLLFDPFLSPSDTVVGDRALLAEADVRARGLRALERHALRLADVVLADTGEMAAFYQALAAPRRLAVVPVGADDALFVPVPEPAGPLEVLFVGHMLPLHGLDTILAAARRLEDDARVRFHLVGPGEFAGPNIRHTPGVPFAELPALIANAQVCLGLFGGSAKAARVVPHKVYQAAAVGRAIVTRTSSAMATAFGSAVLAVPPEDAAALAEALTALADDPGRRQALARAARSTFQERYTARDVARALAGSFAAGWGMS